MNRTLEKILQSISKEEAAQFLVRLNANELKTTEPRIIGSFNGGENLYQLNRMQKKAIQSVNVSTDMQWVVECVDVMSFVEQTVSTPELDKVAFVVIMEHRNTLVHIKNINNNTFQIGICIDLAKIKRYTPESSWTKALYCWMMVATSGFMISQSILFFCKLNGSKVIKTP